MAKVVIVKKLAGAKKKKGAGRPETVDQKRVRGSNGEIRTVRTISADSKTFGSDFAYVFSRNVAKARRENKRVTGSPDVVAAKG